MAPGENLLDVLRTLLQRWKFITFLTLGVGILTALISLLLPNYYQSTTIFYASSVDQAKPGQIFGTSTRDTEFYGDDRDNDRLLTIAESNDLKDYLIQTFDLYQHYDIDSTLDRAAHKVRLRLNKLYNVNKTKRDAIELSVEDTDKELATRMVNAARERINFLAVKVIKTQLNNLRTGLTANINEKNQALMILGDSLRSVRSRYGVYNTETQGDVIATQLLSAEALRARTEARLAALQRVASTPRDTLRRLRANLEGYRTEVAMLKERSDLYNQGLPRVVVLERRQREMSTKLGEENVNLNQLRTVYDGDISAINLIEAGSIPLIKSRPKRSLWVLSAMLITLIFSTVGILLFESYREVDWQLPLRN